MFDFVPKLYYNKNGKYVVFTTKVGDDMDEFLNVIKSVPLFYGIEESDLSSLLACLSAKIKQYRPGKFIFSEGDKAELVGVVLSGNVQVVKNDFYGNRTIVASIHPGQLFGEAFACVDVKTLPISAVSAELTHVMLINYRKIITTCSNTCLFHNQLIFNMLKIVANKNIVLSQKIEFLSKRTTKEKLMTYLLFEAKKQGSSFVIIPFNRQELADYLCVDRSAMSNELSKLSREGKIEFHKNMFKLKDRN